MWHSMLEVMRVRCGLVPGRGLRTIKCRKCLEVVVIECGHDPIHRARGVGMSNAISPFHHCDDHVRPGLAREPGNRRERVRVRYPWRAFRNGFARFDVRIGMAANAGWHLQMGIAKHRQGTTPRKLVWRGCRQLPQRRW